MQIEDSYPLSPIQHGMLVHSLSAPQSGVYIQQLVSLLREELNVIAFQRAWEQVLRRHPALRTSFFWEGREQPVQRVHRDVLLPFQNLDWSGRAPDDQEKQLECFLQTDRQLGFRLDQAPLIRLTLVRCAQAEYRLIWTSHHALFDGRSRLLLLNEVFAFYEAICRGENLNLSNPSPYRSYIDWLQKQNISAAENFWRTRLKGLNAGQSLTGNHRQPTPPQVQSYGKKTTRLSETDTRALRSLVEQYQLTPNTLLQGAWALLLSRYSGEDGVVFGAIRAGRHALLEGAESMIGLLINTVPIPVHVSPNSRLLPWLNSLRSEWIAMRDFEHTPLVKIHEWSPIPSGKPLFESLLVFENYQLNALMHEQGDRWKNREFHLLGTTHYPLTVAGYLGPDLSLEVTYDQQRFDEETITRMLNHLRTLLEEMVRDPNRQLLDIPLLSPVERHQLLVEWNDTKRDYPSDKCIPQLFEEQIERTPEAAAVVFEDRQLTYRELNHKANQLAHYLRKHGVGPDDLVGICMERSVEMVIGLLGILKAGGAYVPLDPSYPKERSGFMLKDTHANIVLTDLVSRNSLPPISARVICLDRDWKEIAKEPQVNPSIKSTADNLAYVIYTSGSTGVPKGVEVRHRGVVRLLFGVDYVQLDGAQTFLHLAPISFDAATFEVWGALLHGGKCVLFPGKVPCAEEFGNVLKKHRVNTLWLTAALFNMVINEEPQALSEVKQLLIGGEALSVPHVKKGLALLPNTEVINGYGPTESTTFTCCYRIPRQLDDNLSSFPIGKPIGNTQVYILDPHLTPVPIGVAGELHIGGDGLARGYLNRPELTAEKFIPNPFSADPTSRLYKTGDLARYLPDGNIEFLGRIDNQVKLRGYRIELGEIEAVLAKHAGVRETVVLAREDNPGDKRLVAYIVAGQKQTPNTLSLRNFLKQKLPDYMVPSTFVMLDSLPLTPNGKVDRKALPAPDQGRPELGGGCVAPRTPTEELLAGIWAEVLKVERVGIRDNFFELGGHSLLATQVMSRIGATCQAEIPLRFLFESPTVAGLAERIEQLRRQEQGLQTLPMLAVSRDKDLPLSFAQQRLWFLDQYEPNSSIYNIPGALRLKGALDVPALVQSLNEIVRRHESLRTTFSVVDGEPVQVIAPALKISLPFTDLMDFPESDRENEAQRLATEQAREPFDLSQGPVVRVTLLRLREEDHVLLLTLHHIVSDGWSMGVFYRELSLLCEAFSNGQPSPFAELPIQYADFAVWQRQWLQGEVLENQLSYWKKQLAGAPAMLNLPTDRPRPAVQSYRGASQSIELSQELSEGLKALSAQHGGTLFMILLAAFQTLLHRYTGQNDIVVGSPIANRNRAEIEGLIGFFVNTLVMRTDLSGNPTFKELLTRVRETALGAYTHQDLPFEKLVEEFHPERSLSHSPLFQVMFVLQNAPSRDLEFSGLSLDFMPIESRTAKFDLLLSVSESARGLRASLEYSTDLFDAATIGRMIGHFQTWLAEIVARPEQRISDLPILTEAESDQLLVGWNNTETDFPKDKCIHELFEEQVKRSPESVALVLEDQRLTYRELNQRANQLAHYLQALGVGPEQLVGICLERSREMVIGLLGILKAGAAYVPLDPGYPRERLAFMLADTQAAVLITTQRLLEGLPNYAGRTVCLDAEWDSITHQTQQEPVGKVTPANLAYAIYTSGSSGQPKAVAMSHRSLCNLLSWQLQNSTHPTPARTLQFASLSFDVSFQEIFATFCSGGTLVLISEELRRDAVGWLHYLRDQSVERLFLPFVALQQLAETAGHERTVPESLREIITAGEQLHITPPIISLFNKLKDCKLHNQYGPSESHVVTAFTLTGPSDTWPSLPPIGRPISNTQIFLLDRYLNPAPVGVSGELCIGGDSLARDYLNRPELTAEKFIPNPFSSKPGARLYRTGDRARYLPDGNIEFLGRADNQVKIRGYRIELGEIEAVLGQHPAIKQTVVLAREDSPGDRRLVAYSMATEGSAPTAHELRSHLQQKLPEYMVPSAFMFLKSLPLTPNGKLDRKALPAPDHSRPELDDAFAAPRTPVEEILANIWAEILKLDKVGIHDNFFHLGGHSLLATQVVSRVNTAFQTDLPLRRLFESPTIASLADSMQASMGNENDSRTVQPIVPLPRSNDTPLSFAQERLWFLDRLDPDSATYNVPAAFRLAGDLNVNALEQSLNEVVRRHESLRTVFATVNGNPVQKILPSLVISLAPIDLSERPENQREPALQSLIKQEAIQPFDLSRGPLIRACLWRLAPHDHVLALNMHHIVSDGWSMGVLFRELSARYESYGSGEPQPLPELPVQYEDYALWQRDWLQGENLDVQLSYWRKQLDSLSTLQLPTDRPRPAVQTYRGSSQSTEISTQLSQAIKGLGQREGVTLFMALLAAFQTLLSRYCEQSDIAVGTPIAGRTRQETEGLIGFFVNTLVLRTDLSTNPTFKQLLRQVRETTLEAYAHQDLPFEKLVEELHPERNPSISPLFQVMFVLQNTGDSSLELEGLSTVPIRTVSNIAKFDLSLTMAERDGKLRASLNFNTDLFDASTIERMLGHFQVLLEGIVANPEQRISDLPLLTEAEKHQLLIEWNNTKTDYPKDKSIHELFEAQVENSPDSIALVFEDQRLTYRELNARANQLAHHLQTLGVGPEVLVGICVERSLEMIVAILGILKAGGAYVPMDPSYPKERLAFMLEDSRVPVLITQSSLIERLPNHNATVLCLDRDWGEISTESQDNPLPLTIPDNLAYVIYTSGSMGTPKGALIAHHNVVRLFRATGSWFHFSPDDVWTLFHSYAFDFSVWELWGALFHGGRLVIVPFEVSRSPQEFYELLCREQVTVLNQTPSAFRQLLQAENSAIDPSRLRLRLVIFGGETLDFKSLKPWLDRHGDQRPQLINMYGITETTVHVTYRVIKEADLSAGLPSLIGVPIPDLELYVLDPYRNLVPVGVPGELYVGGAGLARGYLNRGELTAERFVGHPFDDGKGRRLYRSGDLVRRRADGDIEYLGRIDNQVKIRGHRIELGEIESVLSQHPEVRESVVLAREDVAGDKRLVAYIVAGQKQTPNTLSLRNFLKQKLPDYMVPSTFVMLDSLPLTPNGKVDRKALPAPDQGRPELGGGYVAPRTPTEELLAGIWAEVLKVERVGIHDNFFELGGHSLLATQVMSRLTKAIQIELPLRSLFESPTVAGLAERIEQVRRQEHDLQTLPMLAVSRNKDLPLSFAQQRLWFLDQYEPNSSIYNIPSALRLSGALDVAALEQSLNEIVRRHESLRTTFSVVDGEPVQVIAPALKISLPFTDLMDLPESDCENEAQRLAMEQAREPFDLTQGPLLRVLLVRLGQDDHVLVLTMHHIVSDGWSRGVFYRELSLLYQAYTQGNPSPLSELPIQYADFAVWQRQWLQGEVLENQLSYWKKQLAGAPAMLNLPTDRPRPAVQSYRGASQSIELSQELTQGLKALSAQQGGTLFMTLLAAFQTLLHRYTGQNDIVVGSPIANRNRAEIEGLIGFFVNTLVMRTDLSGNPTFKELLTRVRETALGAYTHQDLPFEKLVEELHPERSLSHSPLFQVLLVLQNAPSTAAKFEGLHFSPVRVGGETAKFDLTLAVHEAPEGLRGSLEYSTELFDEATIERMIGHFQNLLEGIVAHPDQPICELALLTDPEKHQLLVEWNDTKRDYPRDKCIHELFEEQVERTPDAIAAVFEDQQLTYKELNRRANRLARYLRKLGVGPGFLAGICVDRSLEMIVGLLGILKAGGAYVPLEPEAPRERLAVMLTDAQVALLVTEEKLMDRFDHSPVVRLDSDWTEIATLSDANVENTVAAQSVAYAIYTSGSTGKPKGVAVEHQPLVNYSFDIVRQLKPVVGNSFAMVQPLTVDSCITMIFPSLMTGGALHVISRERALSAADLGDYLERWSIDFLKIAPSHLAALQAATLPQRLMPRRCLIIGGEGSRWDWAQSLQGLAPSCAIFNHYGPTETTVGVLMYQVRQGDSSKKYLLSTPLGRPIANTQAYVLDARLRPVPVGVTGELYIGGESLARGYLNQPKLTGKSFISNPFSEEPAARLYKTGDLVRHLPDGNIEFLGRGDDQVKIRGFRVEPAEIETALLTNPQVDQVVVVLGDLAESQTLVAYVVPSKDRKPNASELRDFLRTKLPEYMVPSDFLLLDTLPRTSHGKLDRRALPSPDPSRPALEKGYVAPRTPTEELLAGIWAEVLKVDRVGIHDNFFELGGHSLLAAHVMSRIGATCQAEIPLRFLFESPTIAGLAERIEQCHGQGKGRPALSMFATDARERIPLSFAQQRLWFLDQYEPNSSVYNIPSALRLKGTLDVAALEQSLNEIVRRHEALRTTFAAVDGEPLQVIAPALRVSVPITDLTNHPTSDRENEAQRLAMEQAREPFDLSQGPLLRVLLLRLGADDHVLVLTMHHIVSDGWSRGVFYGELSLLYQAYTQGSPSPLSELPIQYADFAVWQRQWLQGEVLENQLSYWKKQLAGAPAMLNLPTDRPRPAVQSYRGAIQSIELSQELTHRLQALSARQGVTLFMTLLAAFQTLLHRYTGQNDIVVGSPIANRNRAEIEGLIGFFVNTLVMRTDLSGNPTFTELLTRVKETALGAYTHQDLPFEKLVEELHPQRSLSHSPLVQVLFNLLETQNDRLSLPGLDASPFGALAIPSKFDLTLYAIPKPQRLTLTVNYNSDLFDDTNIDHMLGHLCNLLEAITTDCGRTLLQLPLLAEEERRQLLVEWSGSETHPPEHRCIHQLFEDQVQRTPDAIALTDEHLSLSYRELNRRANQFARYLRKRGVATGDLIPIYLERGCDMVIAVLGILKAGGAYVPLDFDYPKKRLAYMLGDTRAARLVTSARCLNRLPEYTGEIICFDRDRHLFEKETDGNPTWAMSATDLSYMYYTSGSTGTPKGVLTSHWGLARYCDFLANTYNLNSADIVLQVASFSFDASVRDMIAPLTVGARVVLVDQQGAKDPTVLISKINQHRITCLLSTVPPMLNELAETMLAEESPRHDSLRLILVGGDALHGSLCRKVHEAFGENTLLVNQYGPTECTMTSSYHPISPTDRQCPTPPIGRPIPHTQLYVLDDDLNPTPVGIEGELCIGGEGLTIGYLNRSDLTAEKFIPHPYSNKPGKRLYRTGDVVRYRSDGTFVFVGRRDGQVKIRSIRIELGEIESVLMRHPKVREAVVLAPEDNSGERQLVAYVVAEEEITPAVLDLRDFLKQHLPEYMVPSFFVFPPALPRSPNGKLDRKALPSPDFKRPEITESFAAPRTAVEKTLAEFCPEILKIDKVGIHDNLFDLGLHSLSATQLVSRVRAKLRVKLPLRHIFEAPTIAGLARLIETLAHDNDSGPSKSRATADSKLIPKRVRNDAHSSHAADDCARPLSIERRPLLSLLAAGKIAPVDAAALSYLSEELLQRMGLPLDTALYDWFDDLPCVFGINETHLGRIAIIGLPRLRSRLYDDQADLVSMILEALEISHRIGGRVVSLTGLIPSATNYGQAIADVISRNDRCPLVTTGHATTVSTVVLTIERILREGGKSLAEENVAFLGLGSIGYTTLRLLLHSLPHPKSITLCDIYSKLDHLKKVRDDLIHDLKFAGSIRIVESKGKVPREVYDAGLVVGATNVPDVLDIEQLKPGTLIVDDSAPHCFNPDEAVQRFKAHEDILFTAGGVLRLPEPFQRTLYLPQRVQEQMPPAVLETISKYNPFHIGGCVLSGLLTARYESLKPTLGIVDDASCKLHYQLLQRLGYQAAGLQCRGYTLPEESVRRFRKRFGYV